MAPLGVWPQAALSFQAGPAMSTCAQGIRGFGSPAVAVAPFGEPTNSERKMPAVSIPPHWSPLWAMSAFGVSSAARRSCGSGMGHIGSPASVPIAATISRRESSLAITAATRLPSAIICAPVSVAMSMIASGWLSLARAMPSAMTIRPSASVLRTSTVVPPYIVTTSLGR